jgi:hypothetical protein
MATQVTCASGYLSTEELLRFLADFTRFEFKDSFEARLCFDEVECRGKDLCRIFILSHPKADMCLLSEAFNKEGFFHESWHMKFTVFSATIALAGRHEYGSIIKNDWKGYPRRNQEALA